MTVIKTELRKVLFENIIVPLISTISFAVLLFATIYMIGSTNDWVKHSDHVLITIEDVEKNFLMAQAKRREYFLGFDSAKEAYFSQFERVQEKIKSLKDLVKDNNLQLTEIENLSSELRIWHEAILPTFEQAEKKPQLATKYFKETMGKFMADPFMNALKEIRTVEQNLREKRNESAESISWLILIILLPSLIVITGVTVFRGRKSILKISDIYESQNNELLLKVEEVSQQNWMQNHEADITKIASSLSSLNDLCENVLKYCVEHFSAMAGSFYVRENDESDVFVLSGSVGRTLGKDKEGDLNRFSAQETFHGLAIKTRTLQVLDASSLSQNWIIRSSVLDLIPQKIISVPLLFSGEVYAVIELAFATNINQDVLSFLRNNLEGIASQTRNQLLLKQTRELLAQLREKSIELEEQQEELRASNEELEERAQLLRESQQEVETRNHELEESNILLEEQADSLERKNNQLEESKRILDQNAIELERANQYKSQFLANMSHELRTPLNSTLILSQLLAENRDSNLTEKQIEYAKQINRSGNDLLALINDILDLSKVEAGELNFELSHFKSDELLESLHGNFAIFAEKKGLKLKVLDHAHVNLKQDRLRLMQVLNNLTSNAIKFTEKGEITVEISKKDETHLQLTVADTGIGIPNDKIGIIFEPFKQADSSITRKYGGTGLGLAITKKIVEAMGGLIKVESQSQVGTKFTVVMPIEFKPLERTLNSIQPQMQKTATAIATTKGNETEDISSTQEDFKHQDDRAMDPGVSKVLVVEDDLGFSKILFDSVKEEGLMCLVAHTAEQALQLINEHRIHALLLDIHLPDHSGLFVLENVRKNEATKKIPVFIISAFDNMLLRNNEHSIKYSKKPLTKLDIEKIVREIQDFSNLMKGKILIVEDDQHQARFLRDHLSQFCDKIDIVSNGVQAYDILTKPHDIECVILDYRLPDCNGNDLLKRIDTAHGAPQLPMIIVHTAMDLSREEEFDLKKYCKSIVIKGQKSVARITSDISTFLKTATAKGEMKKNQSTSYEKGRQPIKNVHVLLVDDDVRNVYSLTAFLEEAGAIVTMASNGRDAIEVLKARSGFDLVLMDVMMPTMDGYEAIKLIRQELNLKMLPIIALTAKAMQEDRKKCIEAGANDYLTKPVDLNKLITMIKMWSNSSL